MSANVAQNYPTFVDLGQNQETGSSENQSMPITVYVDHSESGIIDSRSESPSAGRAIINNRDEHGEEEVKHEGEWVQGKSAEEERDVYETDAVAGDDVNHVWVKDEVELMFNLYKVRQEEINNPLRKKRDVWKEIANELKSYGFNPTPKQCDRKLRNMKATYIKTLERVKKGDTGATCQYYKELFYIYGWNPPLQTAPRLFSQLKKSSFATNVKNDYKNGTQNPQWHSEEESYEPASKKFANVRVVSAPKQDPPPHEVKSPRGFPFHKEKSFTVVTEQPVQNQKIIQELQEELKSVKKALEIEKESREIERKAFEEERREFHKERMSMLGSINRLILNLEQKNS